MKIPFHAAVCTAALIAAPAHAQRTPPSGSPGSTTGGETTGVPPTAGTSPAALPSAPQDDALQDIIVTATKTETTLQKTPVAISTLSGEQLLQAGVTRAQDLNRLIPGLQVEQNGTASSIFIRGVGSRVLNSLADPGTAFSVDGVYYSRATGPSATFFDVARVEVVKGPQGTLYGRNATGGALNVITNRPEIGVRGLDLSIEAGNFEAVRASFAANLPVSDTLALRIAGQTIYHEGYLSDGYDDENTKAVRASALWKPADGLSVFLSADYAHAGGQGPGTIAVGPDASKGLGRFVVPSEPWTGPSDPRALAFLHRAAPATALPYPAAGVYCVGLPFPPGSPLVIGGPALTTCNYPLGVKDTLADGFVDNDYFGANLTADADLGFAGLTAIGGYRGTRTNSRFYIGPASQSSIADSDEYTAELRLASKPNSGRLKWIVGAYYLREDQSASGNFPSNNVATPNPIALPGSTLPVTRCVAPLDPDGPGPAPAIPGLCVASAVVQDSFGLVLPSLTDQTYAFFGQATFSLTDWFRVTGGIRYTHEDKSVKDGVITQFYSVPAGVTTSYPTKGEVRFNDTSYRAGVEIDLAPRSMLYANYSTAFHAGGFNQGVPQGPTIFAYEPEKVKSYVVGIKNRFFDNRLQINVEGFWLDYDNYQIQGLGRINSGSTACTTLGIVSACPISLRTDNAATARTRGVEGDIELKVGRNGTFGANILYNEATFRAFRQANVFTGAVTDYAGRNLPGTPRWTVSADYVQRIPLANGNAIIAQARTQYRTGTYMYYIYVPGNYQGSYTNTDLSLSYELAERRLSITGYVRNVENHATLRQGYTLNAETAVPYNSLNPPRTFGAILGYHF